jgi:hypothetical protein
MDFEPLANLRSRRNFLWDCASGVGMMGLSHLLALEGRTAESRSSLNPMAPRDPHFKPRAKSIIYLFMSGAPSQVDLYDPKPKLKEWHGKPVPESLLKDLTDTVIKGGMAMGSPREFKRHGRVGMDFSDYTPHIATWADDICMIRSMHSEHANHHPAQLLMNCGVARHGHPSLGSWVTYGLGSESQNMPGFVVLTSSSGKGIEGGASLWSNGFLPSTYRGVTFRSQGDPILHVSNPDGISNRTQRARLDAIRDLNEHHYLQTGDVEINSRIAAYELAFRMQAATPELTDFSKESKDTLEMYGINSETTRPFGTNCLLARRMVERGVRVVQLYHSTWDDHSDLNKNLKKNCDMTDQPAAALLKDLKQRGLLDDTILVWGGEFGRTPMNEVRRGNTPGKEGRDHHPYCFSLWLAGGGIEGGQVVGKTDEFGYHVVEDKIHVHDFQATLLHCLGLDHTKLTYRHQGRDFRLTDVGGNVVQKLLA